MWTAFVLATPAQRQPGAARSAATAACWGVPAARLPHLLPPATSLPEHRPPRWSVGHLWKRGAAARHARVKDAVRVRRLLASELRAIRSVDDPHQQRVVALLLRARHLKAERREATLVVAQPDSIEPDLKHGRCA